MGAGMHSTAFGEARVSPVRGYGASGTGAGGDRGTDGRVSRALVAAGLSCLALMVLAMAAAAGGANAKSAGKPAVALQMRAAQQLRMSMLQQDVDPSLPVPAAEQAAPADGSEVAPAAAQADGADAPSSAAGTLAEQAAGGAAPSAMQTAVAPDVKQTEAQKKEARKFLEQGAFDFSFSDNAVPSSETGETMVHMMHKGRPQMLDTAGALARLAAKKARQVRPRHLQGRSNLHLWGLQDHVVHVDTAVQDVGVLRPNEVRVDPLHDVIAQAHYTLQ